MGWSEAPIAFSNGRTRAGGLPHAPRAPATGLKLARLLANTLAAGRLVHLRSTCQALKSTYQATTGHIRAAVCHLVCHLAASNCAAGRIATSPHLAQLMAVQVNQGAGWSIWLTGPPGLYRWKAHLYRMWPPRR